MLNAEGADESEIELAQDRVAGPTLVPSFRKESIL